MIPTLKHYSDIVSDILPSASIYYIFILTLFLTFYLTFFLAFYLTFSLWRLAEVRQCPLRSGARSWDPEVPTEIWSLRLRYGSAHWALELAVEVRQFPLSWSWAPAMPPEIWSSWLRAGSKAGGGGGQEAEALETLTWQVGKKILPTEIGFTYRAKTGNTNQAAKLRIQFYEWVRVGVLQPTLTAIIQPIRFRSRGVSGLSWFPSGTRQSSAGMRKGRSEENRMIWSGSSPGWLIATGLMAGQTLINRWWSLG